MPEHGDRQTYLAGCHCGPCTEADRLYMQKWRKTRQGRISIAARSRAQGWAIAWMIRNEHPRWVALLEKAKIEVAREIDAKDAAKAREESRQAAMKASEVEVKWPGKGG